jgi:hypothetical protein
MGKAIRSVFKLDTLELTECTDGFWLYDTVVSMNLAMRAETEQAALVEALLYYQRRLKKVKKEHKELSDKVDTFFALFQTDEDE